MKREFLLNISFLILINFLVKPVYVFFIESRVQDTLGPNVYGLYFGIFNFAMMLQIISDLGIQNYNSTAVSRDNSLLKEYLPRFLGLKLGLSLIYLIVGVMGALLIGYLSRSFTIFFWVSVNFILMSFIMYLRTNIAATGHYRLQSVISVVDKILLIILLGWMLFVDERKEEFTIFHFIYAQTASYAAVLLITLLINFRLAGVVQVSFDWQMSKSVIVKALPFSFVIILMSLYNRMDGFMLERLLKDNAYQAGIYAASFRVYDALNMVGYLFAMLLLPMFSSLMGKRNELRELIKVGHNTIIGISVALIAGIMLYGEQIMSWMYPNHADRTYTELLGLLLISFFATSLSYNYGTLLTAAKALKPMNKILILGVLINLVLNLIFIPEYGAKGAAITTIATQFFVLTGQYWFSARRFEMGFDIRMFIRRLAYVLAVILLAGVFSRLDTSWHWMSLLIVYELLVFGLIIAFGLIRWRDIKRAD